MEFSIVGIRFNKWKNTYWKGQIVPLEIIRSEIPKYEGRHAVTIYDQILGLMPKNEEKLPIGCRVFATLNTCKNYVKAKIVDKPLDWLSPFSDGSDEYYFSDEFLDEMSYQLCSSYLYNAFTEQCSLIQFHEWLLRMGKDEKNIDSSIAHEFMHFREWIEIEQNNHYRFCGDEQIQAYKEYCIKEEKYDKYDALYSEADLEANLEAEYGKGAWMDDEGAIFNDDGECVGMF